MERVFRQIASRRAGITMIELVIALGILMVVILLTFGFNMFGLRTFINSQNRSDDQFEVRLPMEFISNQVHLANGVTVLNAVPGASDHRDMEIYFDGGQLIHWDGAVKVIPGTMDGDDYNFTATKVSSDTVEFVLGKQGTVSLDVTTRIKALNLNGGEIAGAIGVSGVGIRYTANAVMVTPPVMVGFAENPMNRTADQYSVFNMPSMVPVLLQGGGTIDVPVTWNPTSVNTSQNPIPVLPVSSTGTVNGFPGSVTLRVTISPMPNGLLPPFTVNRSGNKTNVSSATAGATAILRDAGGVQIMTATVSGAGNCQFADPHKYGKSIILKMTGWGDSAPVLVP